MRKIVLLLIVLASTLTHAQKKKVAVVTFYANKMVSFKGLGGSYDLLLKDVMNLRDDPNFNLGPLLEKYHSNFFNEYSKDFPFELLPESEVLSNANYIAFQPNMDPGTYDMKNYLVYDKYKYAHEGMLGEFNEEGMAKALADKADGVMFVHIDFGLVKGFGFAGITQLEVRANTRIALYNKTGEKVFAFTEGENSTQSEIMVAGIPVMEPEKLLPMCETALDQLMKDLKKRLAKISKRSESKL